MCVWPPLRTLRTIDSESEHTDLDASTYAVEVVNIKVQTAAVVGVGGVDKNDGGDENQAQVSY